MLAVLRAPRRCVVALVCWLSHLLGAGPRIFLGLSTPISFYTSCLFAKLGLLIWARPTQFRDGLKKRGVDASLAMIIKQRVRANTVDRMDLVRVPAFSLFTLYFVWYDAMCA